MNILVTGATGFVGSRIVRQLLAEGHEVRGTHLPGEETARLDEIEGALELLPIDLFSASGSELMRLADDIELCIHTAWHVVPGEYLSSMKNIDCIKGTVRLADSLGLSGATRFAGIGTCFEYDFATGLMSEETPTKADSLYAASKTAALHLCEQICRTHGMELVWPRIFYLYGPGEHPGRLVPYAIGTALKGETADFSSGTQIKDFMHVDDVASGIVSAALSVLKGPVNIGSGRETSVREIVQTIGEITGRKDFARFGARPDNPTDPEKLVANNEKLQTTGWREKHDLRSGLEDTIQWWRQLA